MSVIVVFLLVVPLLLCALNAVLNRIPGTHPHRTPFQAGLLANLFVLPAYVLLHLRVFGAGWPALFCGFVFVLVYLNCLVFLNWFIFTLTDVSMHIQLLMQIAAGRVAADELTARYNKDVILGNRVPRLVLLGQLRQENGRLYLQGGSVLFGAAVCMLLRRILGIPLRPEDADHSR